MHIKIIKVKPRPFTTLILIGIATLTGCASILSGQNQSLSVNTPKCPGALCTLDNGGGSYQVKTPGTLRVKRGYSDMKVTCEKDGFEPVTISISSSADGEVMGNAVFGGVAGGGVDVLSGAAYEYQTNIIHPLNCEENK